MRTPRKPRRAGVRQTAGRCVWILGRLATEGTVEVGKKANLVLLDASPLADISNTRQVAAVILNGRLIRGADLQKLR